MKTAVEWLGEKILELGNSYELPEDDIDELIIKAKEMDNERLKEAYSMGRLGKSIKEFNETFKQQEQ